MAPRSKKLASKHPREPSLEQLEFTIPEHEVRFKRLLKLKLRQFWFPNLSALREIQFGNKMAQEIDELLSVGSWRRLLSIKELVIHMLTLEVLTSFEFDRSYINFESIDTIYFRAFGQYQSMNVIQFYVWLGLYDEDYIDTKEYDQLLISACVLVTWSIFFL